MADSTIKMRRDEPVHPGGPVTADVHPEEVANWQQAGWRVDDAPLEDAPDTAPLDDAKPKKPARKR